MKKRLQALTLALLAALSLTPAAADGEWEVTEVIPCQYDYAGNFSEGLAPVYLDGRWGVIDTTGQMVIPCKYDMVGEFHEGLALAVMPDEKQCAFIDRTGQEVLTARIQGGAAYFSEGLAAIAPDSKWGYIDKAGVEVIPCQYDIALEFSEGLAMVCRREGEDIKVGFIDKTGREAVACKYDRGSSFSEGLAAVELDGKCGFIDKTGQEVIPLMYDNALPFSEGLAPVELDGKTGFIDKTGQMAIPFQYDGAWWFSEGLALVELNGKVGFIDRTGREVIPCKYDSAWPFSEGFARVFLNGASGIRVGFIDKTGQEVTPIQYHAANDMSEGLAAVYSSNKWGYISISQRPAPIQAIPTNDTLTVNGREQNATVYKIDDSNYFKIRDLAAVLNGTSKQFSVGYDEETQSVTAVPGQSYEPAGGELAGAAPSGQPAEASNDAIYVNGAKVEAQVYKIDGSNYFKLRDLGEALGFEVGWSKEEGIFINTGS